MTPQKMTNDRLAEEVENIYTACRYRTDECVQYDDDIKAEAASRLRHSVPKELVLSMKICVANIDCRNEATRIINKKPCCDSCYAAERGSNGTQ